MSSYRILACRPRRTSLAICLGLALAWSTVTPVLADTRAPVSRSVSLLPGMPISIQGERTIKASVVTGANAFEIPQRTQHHSATANGLAHPAGPIVVDNCDDSGPGSLRDAIAGAASGDTVDLGSLTCSTITLRTGALVIDQNDLALIGPGAYMLAIDGGVSSGYFDRVFDHTGTGTLNIAYLTITDATYATYAPDGIGKGGCIRSMGNVGLLFSIVSSCRIAQGGENQAAGGGLYVAGTLSILASILRDNTALATDGSGLGGGAVALGSVVTRYATIRDNTATSLGGGLMSTNTGAYGSFIDKTTISGNQALAAAGLVLTGETTATIRNSTISGNRADFVVGGVYSTAPLSVQNSTIAFNSAASATIKQGIVDVGLAMAYDTANLQSSIVANNYIDFSETPRDISALGVGAGIVGNSNLVTHADTPMPFGTLYADPLLYPLAANGGLTHTHALRAESPAIDAGNNSAGLVYDQRLLPRVVGANADIGAFERQGPNDSDVIFQDGFD